MEFQYEATCDLPCAPGEAWAVLVAFDDYAAWNPFTTSVRCALRRGESVVMRVNLGFVTITQAERVTAVEPPTRLAWALDIGWPWLLRAERVQTVVGTAEGCRYRTVDTIGGLLSPLVELLFGRALRRGFTGVAVGLAAHIAGRSDAAGPSRGPGAPAGP
jgi:hypothetical protein